MNARHFQKEHIDAILAKMVSFKHPMTTIKIKLYEKKQDYVEAFELHFSNPQLKKKVFNWVEVTLQTLHDEELTFQDKALKTMIESAKSEGLEPVTYEPLKRLKVSMKRRMVELA